ncbi:DUF4013 domain-containing protein [Candidatus Woesearchaeota archaeon]|nr:DUF4013 domain-containing protein [Candidatus Woesearchaeota archaeon]
MATIGEALKFPFARFKRLFYWLWVLIPIIGLLAFSGYILRIIQAIIKGNYKEVPKFGRFWPNCVLGLYSWILGLVIGFVVSIFSILQIFGGIAGAIAYVAVTIYAALVGPIMVVQLAETEDLSKAFNVVRAHKIVFNNFSKYIIVVLQQIAVSIVLLIASIPIITLIITIPAMSYAKQYLYAGFYRDVKKKPKY